MYHLKVVNHYMKKIRIGMLSLAVESLLATCLNHITIKLMVNKQVCRIFVQKAQE